MGIRKHAIVRKIIEMSSLHPNVQRLAENFPRLKDFVIYVPPALVGFLNYDERVLEECDKLIKSGKNRGNTKELTAYKKILPQELTPVQFQWAVGMVLSDATLQYNNNTRSCRIKMQQVDYHFPFLAVSCGILAPWVLEGISDQKKNKVGSMMQEMQTMRHEAFLAIADLFQDPSVPKKKEACVKKVIRPEIGQYLTPICLAAWFIGDGGRQDYSNTNPGEGLQFHTQGFSKEDVNLLVSLLHEKYGWKVSSEPDGLNKKGEEMFLINLDKSNFASFMEQVSPYIPEYFDFKLPIPRRAEY